MTIADSDDDDFEISSCNLLISELQTSVKRNVIEAHCPTISLHFVVSPIGKKSTLDLKRKEHEATQCNRSPLKMESNRRLCPESDDVSPVFKKRRTRAVVLSDDDTTDGFDGAFYILTLILLFL